jgi:hypothetical protein
MSGHTLPLDAHLTGVAKDRPQASLCEAKRLLKVNVIGALNGSAANDHEVVVTKYNDSPILGTT